MWWRGCSDSNAFLALREGALTPHTHVLDVEIAGLKTMLEKLVIPRCKSRRHRWIEKGYKEKTGKYQFTCTTCGIDKFTTNPKGRTPRAGKRAKEITLRLNRLIEIRSQNAKRA